MIYILTMVFMLKGPADHHITSIVVEYSSPEKCEAAKKANREALNPGSVILATCTVK